MLADKGTVIGSPFRIRYLELIRELVVKMRYYLGNHAWLIEIHRQPDFIITPLDVPN